MRLERRLVASSAIAPSGTPTPAAPPGEQTAPELRPVEDPTSEDEFAHFVHVLAASLPGAEPRPTPPVVCADFAGLPLLHAGELTFLYGRPKTGKSWATLAMAR